MHLGKSIVLDLIVGQPYPAVSIVRICLFNSIHGSQLIFPMKTSQLLTGLGFHLSCATKLSVGVGLKSTIWERTTELGT